MIELAMDGWWRVVRIPLPDISQKPCKYCGKRLGTKWNGQRYRSHREFCSDTCKKNDYRRNKRNKVKRPAK